MHSCILAKRKKSISPEGAVGHTRHGGAFVFQPSLRPLTAWGLGFKSGLLRALAVIVVMYAEIPAISFISVALTLVPLTWYYYARNVAAVAIGAWLSIANLIYAANYLLWDDNTDIKALILCDISTAFITGSRIALPAACLSICIHLERLASFSQTSTTRAKRRRIVFEYSMSFGLPLVYIALHLIVQPHRFDLFYGFGCRPATYPTVATVFLILIPPLLLTAGTVIFACIAWRHFLVHGVHFHGKKCSVSFLTRDLYIRLVGMALIEAVFSAVMIGVAMWGLLRSGLMPIETMSRNLSEVRVWGPDELTGSVRTVLMVEWLVTVVQSIMFFGLFACRMEVLREGWELVQSLLRSFRRPAPPVTLDQDSSTRSSFMGTSVQTLPMTEIDLSMIIESESTLTPYPGGFVVRQPKGIASRRPSTVEDADGSENMFTALAPSMMPLESPTHASAIASSHNSLSSSFDLGQLILSPDVWPQTPTSILAVPVPVRLSRRSFGMGRVEQGQGHRAELKSWVEVGQEDVLPPLPLFPRIKYAVHERSCFADVFDEPEEGRIERHRGVYVTVMKEIRG